VVAPQVPTVAMGKEHGCTATAATAMARTAAIGTASDCPNTAVEVDAAVLRVGYIPCGTWEEHR
jgi:hypothetical protein